jgi:beta-1,4-N-acetylglucosaminyltransferase
MIFVTVGTTYKFDELIREIDKIAPLIKEDIIIQIGKSNYIPKNCKYFRFTKSLIPYFKKANLIISHGGAGTTYEVLKIGKKLISVENRDVNDAHQWDLLKKLSDKKYTIWCKDVSKIHEAIKLAEKHKLKKYAQPKCSINKKIIMLVK